MSLTLFFYPVYNDLMNDHPKFRHLVEKVWSKHVVRNGECCNCRAKVPFTIPRRGYSNGAGVCPACGVRYTMLSNFGDITLFPIGVLEKYSVELLGRVAEHRGD